MNIAAKLEPRKLIRYIVFITIISISFSLTANSSFAKSESEILIDYCDATRSSISLATWHSLSGTSNGDTKDIIVEELSKRNYDIRIIGKILKQVDQVLDILDEDRRDGERLPTNSNEIEAMSKKVGDGYFRHCIESLSE